jgi:hypothetical protein
LLAAGFGLAGCPAANEQGFVRAAERGDLSYAALPMMAFDREQASVCGAGGSTEAGDAGFDRTPYLQKTTASGTALAWTTPVDGDFSVEWFDASGELVARTPAVVDTSAQLPDGDRQWVAEVADLKPDSTYCYQIVAGDQAWTAPTGMRTAPADDSATVRFVALGDLGTVTPDQIAVFEQLRRVHFDFGLITGDVAYDDGRLAELEDHYFGVYADVIRTVPWYTATGNHDYNTDDAEPFLQAFVQFENGGPDASSAGTPSTTVRCTSQCSTPSGSATSRWGGSTRTCGRTTAPGRSSSPTARRTRRAPMATTTTFAMRSNRSLPSTESMWCCSDTTTTTSARSRSMGSPTW